MFSVRSGGATGIISRGFVDAHNSTFCLEDQGPMITIKLSPDQKILAVQRAQADVQFIGVNQLGSNGIFDSRQYSQGCKTKNAVILGFSWTGPNEIAYFTDHGIEIYLVLHERRILKSVRNQSATFAWYTFCPRSNICVAAPTQATSSLLCFSIRSGYIYKLPKIEYDKADGAQIKENDVAVLGLHDGRHYVAVVVRRQQTTEVHLHAVSSDQTSITRSHILKVPAATGNSVAINVVDNVVVVHHQATATSYLYDVVCGGGGADFDGSVHRHAPVCLARVRAPAGAANVELYSQHWVTFQPDIVVDAKIGMMWRLKLSLNAKSCLRAVNSMPALVGFLQQRESAKMVLVDVFFDRCQSPATAVRTIGSAFDLVNVEYRRHLNEVVQSNLALPASSFPSPTAAFKQASSSSQAADKTPAAKVVLDQSDVYTNVFAAMLEDPETANLKRVESILIEYYRSLSASQIPPQYFLNELLINVLVQRKSWFQLHQLLQYHVISDSKAVACLLLSLESVYAPAYQLALDMLAR